MRLSHLVELHAALIKTPWGDWEYALYTQTANITTWIYVA